MLRRTALLPALSVCASIGLLVALAAPVVAAPAAPVVPKPTGGVTSSQDTFNHTLRVAGYAYDASRPTSSITVRIYADGHFVAQTRADGPSPATDRAHRITGRHAFLLTLTRVATTSGVKVFSAGASSTTTLRLVASSRTTHHQPAAAQRVITVAKRYVGKARYVSGGTSPKTGFDCSGYTRYVFGQARVAKLARTAEQQRRSGRAVSARSARAGDLVFYGVPAYHVAIYAGHGMQYAAATERDGIRYQRVWSSDVQYRRVS